MGPKEHPSRRERGLSLIELLVVVAIVVVLAAILFPVVARAREASKRSVCLGNLHSLGIAEGLYVQDSDDAHPLEARARPQDGWATQILPYLKGEGSLQCPSEPTPTGHDPARTGFVDYFHNRYAFGLPASAFASPAGSILLMDGIGGTAENWEDGTGPGYLDCRGDSSTTGATPGIAAWLDRTGMEPRLQYAARHLGSANYLLADGHARALGFRSVWNNCTVPAGKTSFAYR